MPSGQIESLVPSHKHLDGGRKRPLVLFLNAADGKGSFNDLPLTDRAVLVEWAAGFRNWRGWKPLVQRVALRYQLSRMGHKPLRGRWPDASFGAAAFRLRTQVHEVVYLFRKPPKGAALEAWEEALPDDHLWRLENRRNRLEEVLAVPADEAPKKRSRF